MHIHKYIYIHIYIRRAGDVDFRNGKDSFMNYSHDETDFFSYCF